MLKKTYLRTISDHKEILMNDYFDYSQNLIQSRSERI